MNIPAFYSDQDFKFQNDFLINPDVIEAFKVQIAVFKDSLITTGNCLDHNEHDFGQDLSKMIDIYKRSTGQEQPREAARLNALFQQCLGLKIRHLQQVAEAMPTIRHADNDARLYSVLQDKLNEVSIYEYKGLCKNTIYRFGKKIRKKTFLQDLERHNDFVKIFLETRKIAFWKHLDVESISVPARPPAQSVLTAYQDYLQFDRDFRGFCSILNKCIGTDSTMLRLAVQRSAESQTPPEFSHTQVLEECYKIPDSQVPD